MRSGERLVRLVASVTLVVSALVAAVGTTAAAQEDPRPPAPRPFATVLEQVVPGDLVMAGNSNLLSAGGWRSGDVTVADIDDDSTEMCIIRGLGFPRACADNSSSARLDLPRGARVLEARLYVQSTVAPDVGPLKVRLDAPGRAFRYRELGGATMVAPKLYEAGGGRGDGAPLRQAVWDVTELVARHGAGSYTVADIVSERAAPYLPYASWAIVAAYEFDPASGFGLADLRPAERQRFAERALSWHDGFAYLEEGSVDVPVSGFEIPTAGTVFAKSFHVVGHGQLGESDNLLFNGNPLGNNLTPGDAPPPAGVVIGANPSCNSTTDVQNDTVCVLGTPVASKRPGRRDYLASGDGRTRSSGSGVDIDVLRIPDRYLVPGSTAGSLSVQVTGSDTLAPGMLAVSVDLPTPTRPAVVRP
jgi:large repetitive protein